jgi:hypothetical protein
MGERRGTYRVLVGNLRKIRPLGRLRRTFEDNFKIYFQKVGRWTWTGFIWLRIGKDGELL